MVTEFAADGIRPLQYKCLRCHLQWGDGPDDYSRVTCSNCYSERVIITVVRLMFENWGEHNGGEMEQRARFDRALELTAKAIKALEDLDL